MPPERINDLVLKQYRSSSFGGQGFAGAGEEQGPGIALGSGEMTRRNRKLLPGHVEAIWVWEGKQQFAGTGAVQAQVHPLRHAPQVQGMMRWQGEAGKATAIAQSL